MRWGAIVHFISETVLTGFKIGAGLVIAASQLPLLFGISHGGDSFADTLARVVAGLPHLNVPSFILGMAALAMLIAGQMKCPHWPVPLMTVALAIAFTYLPGTGDLGIAAVGAIPQGLPRLILPQLDASELDTLLPLALACFIIAYNEAAPRRGCWRPVTTMQSTPIVNCWR